MEGAWGDAAVREDFWFQTPTSSDSIELGNQFYLIYDGGDCGSAGATEEWGCYETNHPSGLYNELLGTTTGWFHDGVFASEEQWGRGGVRFDADDYLIAPYCDQWGEFPWEAVLHCDADWW